MSASMMAVSRGIHKTTLAEAGRLTVEIESPYQRWAVGPAVSRTQWYTPPHRGSFRQSDPMTVNGGHSTRLFFVYGWRGQVGPYYVAGANTVEQSIDLRPRGASAVEADGRKGRQDRRDRLVGLCTMYTEPEGRLRSGCTRGGCAEFRRLRDRIQRNMRALP
jgi:hypothetical protein